MADEKKPEIKSSASEAPNVFAEIMALLVVLMLVVALFNSISSRFNLGRLLSGISTLNPRSILISHTRPISFLANPIGARVISINKTDVYDSPGGRKIGSQKIGARGQILQGPVTINGTKYWYVDYDSGVDGWVAESDIAYLETELNFIEKFLIWLLSITGYLKLFAILFSIAVVAYIVYLNNKISPILENERKLLYPIDTKTQDVVNAKWVKIQAHVESLNESDWRIAIIEADILLDELLEKLSLPGDTIGDKLKAVERSDFLTLDNALEAHRMRNRISHQGGDFKLNQREAKATIALYQSVFEEFEII